MESFILAFLRLFTRGLRDIEAKKMKQKQAEEIKNHGRLPRVPFEEYKKNTKK